MVQTPLHVSAGHNRAQIVKSILDWQDQTRLNWKPRLCMEKPLCTWQQRMGVMKLHRCFLLMELQLKPKQTTV
ncbi:Protein cfxQ like [Quillaja saponaria]|uniref:Protein cfxQ like n=1 Tax=Quillaja saponaria TaxID=32244 RepID=A0AAD7VFL5_QUISA|nr:Protein cfxQ like [Quillaja saponaria]